MLSPFFGALAEWRGICQKPALRFMPVQIHCTTQDIANLQEKREKTWWYRKFIKGLASFWRNSGCNALSYKIDF